MKKTITLLLAVILCFSFLACGKSQGTEASGGSDKQNATGTDTQNGADAQNKTDAQASSDTSEEKTLDIYYLSEHVSSVNIISKYKKHYPDVKVNVTPFNTIEEMDTQIATLLNGGKGPDVILFVRETTLDTGKIALGDTFLDLAPYMAADATFDRTNYYNVLDAGVAAGKQTLMPLRFKCAHIVTSEEKLEKAKLTLPTQYSMTDLMQGIMEHAATCDENSSAFQNLCPQQDIGGVLYDDLRLTGVELVDLEAEEWIADPETFEEYAAFEKVIYEQLQKNNTILKGLETDFIGAMDKLTMLKYDDSLCFNIRYQEAIFKEGINQTLSTIYYPNYADEKTVTADICLYAAVLESSDNPQLAYEFIRFGMDTENANIMQDLAVSKASVADVLDDLQSMPGGKVSIGSKQVAVAALSDETRAQCEAILNSISAGSIRNYAVESILTETMEPYLKGEADFESCYTKLKNQLSIYLYE